MSTATILPGPGPAIIGNTFQAISAVNGILVGTPVAWSRTVSGQLQLCSASSSSGKIGLCCGIALTAGGIGQSIVVQYSGLVVLSTSAWDAVVAGESGGLTEGEGYFVSPTDGELTTTQPTGFDPVTPVGIAQNSTTMQLQITLPVVD